MTAAPRYSFYCNFHLCCLTSHRPSLQLSHRISSQLLLQLLYQLSYSWLTSYRHICFTGSLHC
ncbi:MAG: hypothetical protein ACK56F_16625, partial [bacterium]